MLGPFLSNYAGGDIMEGELGTVPLMQGEASTSYQLWCSRTQLRMIHYNLASMNANRCGSPRGPQRQSWFSTRGGRQRFLLSGWHAEKRRQPQEERFQSVTEKLKFVPGLEAKYQT
ncbi:hypothetical protein RB195_024238 [Necator americanus]|uniref:Uncharacterized protein n=1 Tax=Necator americanus TaxID=51031 RepID=A0ABR1EPM9_NECAM